MVASVIDLGSSFFSKSVKDSAITSVQKRLGYVVGAFLTLLLLNVPLYAQGFSWPENPVNIQVLSEALKRSTLRANMVGFTVALGVRCSYCHVGVEGEPLSTYDFPSDENPNKNRARVMFKMVDAINNEHLSQIESSTVTNVDMWCHTCHRGISRPISLGEELEQSYKAEGLDATLAKYSELKV